MQQGRHGRRPQCVAAPQAAKPGCERARDVGAGLQLHARRARVERDTHALAEVAAAGMRNVILDEFRMGNHVAVEQQHVIASGGSNRGVANATGLESIMRLGHVAHRAARQRRESPDDLGRGRA